VAACAAGMLPATIAAAADTPSAAAAILVLKLTSTLSI